MKSKVLISLILALVVCLSSVGALACTAIYVGSDLTADGSTMFARSEDIANSYNKLFYVSPAGANAEGEVYQGCYGFTWTFTHDSYSYTAFSDDNGYGVDNVCPDCGGTHKHTPYQAAGTNEMGVTVSATETIGGSEAVEAVDPFADTGIEEAEIVTVVLGEAATAKEGVELLLSIYDEAGCCGGSGLFIADQNETWYIENVTGHQYIALKLSSSMAFAQPNMAAAPADAKVYYPTTTTVRTEEGRETVEGFCVLPEDWADSMFWSLDALSNLALSGGASEEQIAEVNAKLAEAQQQCYDAFAEMQAAVSEAADEAAAQEAATSISEEAAANVHAVAVELVNGLTA